MKKTVKKIFENNEYYDDILGTVVTENRFKIWSMRVVLLAVPILIILILARDVF